MAYTQLFQRCKELSVPSSDKNKYTVPHWCHGEEEINMMLVWSHYIPVAFSSKQEIHAARELLLCPHQ